MIARHQILSVNEIGRFMNLKSFAYESQLQN